MGFRTTAVLFGVVFLLGIGLLIYSFSEEDNTPTKELLLANLAGVKAEEVDTVELEKGSTRLVLKRKDKDWTITEPVTAKAETGSIDRLVESILKVRATSYPELSSNAAVHGLDTPSLRVTLRSGDKSDTLNIGDVTIGGSKAVGFVTTSTRKRPMAVARADLDSLFKESKSGSAGDLAKWANDYRVKQVFAVDSRTGADDVAFIKLTQKGKELALAKSAGGAWQFASPAGWGDAALTGEVSSTNPSAITGVRGLLNTIVNLQAAAADDFIDRPGDLKEYGLNADNPDLIRVELKDKNGVTEVALMAKKQDAPAPPAVPGGPLAPPPPARLYVKLEGSNTVVRVNPPPTLDGLIAAIANPDPLRDRDLVKDTDKNRIDAIDITVGGQVTKLRKSGGPFGEWKLYGGSNDPQTANPQVVAKLLDLVAKPGIVKDFPSSSDANFTPAETRVEIKLWTDGIKPNADPKADPKAEPKVEGPPIVLQFGKKDAEGIFVRRTQTSGAKNDCRVPEKVKVSAAAPPPSPFGAPPPPPAGEEVDVVAGVARTRLDFLDPSLKGFSQFQANKVTIQNGPNLTEIVKEKPSDMAPFAEVKWKFAKPDAQKDRTADSGTVSDLLTMLSTESVVKFVSESPSDADLAKWGLDPKAPKLKVIVGLDTGPPPIGEKKDKPESERVWLFGNETDDKQHVYARQEGKTAVFTVRKLTAERFATADLRDKTIVRFDKSKVKKLSFKGWKEKTGFVLELVFEKKDGAWVATKSPGAYMVDSAKVEKFLDASNNLRAKGFLAGPAKPEQKLSPEDGALQVFIEFEGAPLLTFTVGSATDADASYFLQTSTLPANENIVTVLIDTFKAYKDNSGAFAK